MFDQFKSIEEFYEAATIEDKEYRNLKISEERLHIKKLLTAVNKYKFENITHVKVFQLFNNY